MISVEYGRQLVFASPRRFVFIFALQKCNTKTTSCLRDKVVLVLHFCKTKMNTEQRRDSLRASDEVALLVYNTTGLIM
jgi:hypothetical protein